MAPGARADVWRAMSELFLDTEVRPALPYVASVCVDSGYDDALLDHVFRYEVSPALCFNLLLVAGVWEGFGDEWLLRTLREVPAPATRWQRLRARCRPVPTNDWWLTLELVRYLRALPDGQRSARTRTLAFLVEAYVSEGRTMYGSPFEESVVVAKQIFDEVLEPRLERMIVRGVEKWTHADGCRYVSAALRERSTP